MESRIVSKFPNSGKTGFNPKKQALEEGAKAQRPQRGKGIFLILIRLS